jgi:hypothetical protein
MTQVSGFGRGVSQVATLKPPAGLKQILATFGDIYEYIRPDGGLDSRWRADFLCRVTMPFELPLSWDRTSTVSRMTCHRRLAGIFVSVFDQIQVCGLQSRITSFGGCFAFRPQRTGTKLSTHSWGIAIDLNPESNAQGTPGTMDSELIEVFRDAGFQWGGDWSGSRRDPMHFQFCTGY